MVRVVFRTQALEDLDSIADYMALDSVDRAIDHIIKLKEACYALENFPERGVVVDKATNRRRLVYGNYNIFYRLDGETVFIISIVEGHRDVKPGDLTE